MTICERLAIMTTGLQTITRAQLTNANLIGDIEMGKHTGRMIRKTGKRRSGKTDKGGPIAKRKVVRQKATTMLGTAKPARPKTMMGSGRIGVKKKNVLRTGMKKGGFPDLSGDGKITQKDILMGRGVIKKAGGGSAMPGMKKRVMAKRGKSIKKRVKKNMGGAMKKRVMKRGGGMMKKPMLKRGGKVKK